MKLDRLSSLGLASLAALASTACGGAGTQAPPPSAPANASDVSPATTVASASATPPGDFAPPAPSAASRRPLELKSFCATATTVYLGDDPAKGDVGADIGKRGVDANGTLSVPRRADGSQTVWLLDEKGAPLVSVKITRGMNTIEIGKSCRTIDSFMRK